MSTPKKQRLSDLARAAEHIKAITVPRYKMNSDDLKVLESLKTGIRPGIGVIGTESEEIAIGVKHDGTTDAGGNNAEDDNTKDDDAEKDDAERDDAEDDDTEDDDTEDDDAEDILDDETETSNEHIALPDGRFLTLHQYYGQNWTERIEALHNVQPLEIPPNMTLIPHDYQLKGAAQIDFLCKSSARGAMVGDGMGLGKTLQAVLSMWMQRDEPGLSLVVCPASLCLQWVACINGAFEEGHGLTAIHLNDSSISAHQLLAGGYDAVVCSYEFVDANCRARNGYAKAIETYHKASDFTAMRPKRPTAAIASELWTLTKIPFKRGYQDECHQVNKRNGQRHRSLMSLAVESWVMMSGTLPHNKWHDISGYLDFIKGHPYTTHTKFMHQFASSGYTGVAVPSGPQMRLLQRFLQPFLIMRARDVLRLPPCERIAFPVRLQENHANIILDLTESYRKALAMEEDKGEDKKTEISPLGKAIRAQMYALHYKLADPNAIDGDEELDLDDLENITYSAVNIRIKEKNAVTKRKEWLQRLEKWTHEELFDSPHLRALTDLLAYLASIAPAPKVVVFSQYLKYLDIVCDALKKKHNIECLRFDGTVAQSQRPIAQQKFEDATKFQPLLITAGAGSVGLNLTAANFAIQCEEWWNDSAETQAVCRLWRQGQTKTVHQIKFYIENSAIDAEISVVRRRKVNVNSQLMEPLYHTHENCPEIVELVT